MCAQIIYSHKTAKPIKRNEQTQWKKSPIQNSTCNQMNVAWTPFKTIVHSRTTFVHFV